LHSHGKKMKKRSKRLAALINIAQGKISVYIFLRVILDVLLRLTIIQEWLFLARRNSNVKVNGVSSTLSRFCADKLK